MRRAKIVCTLGPATESSEQVQALVDAGMDVARINRSHGSAEEAEVLIGRVRAAAEASGRPVAVLVDLQGPKIRLGTFVGDQRVKLDKGDEFTITIDDVLGTVKRVSTTFKGLPGDCKPGDRLLIDDGNVAVRVTAVTDTDVITKVEVPGYVSNHKGLNLPGVAVSVPALSEKDREDLRWALTRADADVIALSFVRSASDIDDVHAIMDEVGVRLPVIAKIEKPQAVDKLFEIVSAFDGIMVARGDLGVEMPLEAVPLVQKRAIELARRQAKPVIVATQVLESMIQNPRPTRAEASDCANAILDGADAVMLSGETSVGAFPIETVRTMAAIIESTEENGGERIASIPGFYADRAGVICDAAARIAEHMDARYLVTFSQSGTSARLLSRMRRPIPMLAFTPLESTRRRLALSWGIQTYRVPEVQHTDDMVWQLDQVVQSAHLADIGDQLVIVAGMPPGIAGSSNMLRIHEVGDEADYAIGGTRHA